MNDEKPFAKENPFAQLDKSCFPKKGETAPVKKPSIKKSVHSGKKNAHVTEPLATALSDEDTELFLASLGRIKPLHGSKATSNPEPEQGLRTPLPMPTFADTQPMKQPPAPASRKLAVPSHAPVEPTVADAEPESEWRVFASAMGDVAPLPGKGREIMPEIPLTPPVPLSEDHPLQDFMDGKIEFALNATSEYVEGHVLGLDLMLVGKLQAGQFSAEAHLDLHGLSSQQAFHSLVNFIRGAYMKDQRAVLVVPGRGLNSPSGFSVLRDKVQEWLTQEPLRRVVLAFCTARQTDGGAGALYVLLRRFRKDRGKVQWDRFPADPDLM